MSAAWHYYHGMLPRGWKPLSPVRWKRAAMGTSHSAWAFFGQLLFCSGRAECFAILAVLVYITARTYEPRQSQSNRHSVRIDAAV